MRPTRICRLSRQIKTPKEARERERERKRKRKNSNVLIISIFARNVSISLALCFRSSEIDDVTFDRVTTTMRLVESTRRKSTGATGGGEGGANEKARWMKQKGEETRLEESTTENGGW